MDDDITGENLEKLRRMEQYLLLAIKNGDIAWVDGSKVVISFYRSKKDKTEGAK